MRGTLLGEFGTEPYSKGNPLLPRYFHAQNGAEVSLWVNIKIAQAGDVSDVRIQSSQNAQNKLTLRSLCPTP